MKIAAVITKRIGQIARAAPSNAPENMIAGALENGGATAIMKEPIAAIPQAFQAGTFRIARATMSHRIGNKANKVVICEIVLSR